MLLLSVLRDARGGCHGCKARWSGPTAFHRAALHHHRTGHKTWVECAVSVRYGEPPKGKAA